MKALDLFSGSGSWKNIMKKTHDVVSVDITNYGKFDITHQVDILTWDYKIYEPGSFDIISAGCPCIWYSVLQNAWIGRKKRDKKTKKLYTYTRELYEKDLEYSDKLVLKTLEIIDYFKPRLWFIENPYSSKLKKRDFMKDKPFYVVDYCCYGFDYKKSTIIFTNKKNFKPQRCQGLKCPAVISYNKQFVHKKNCALSVNSLQPKAVALLKKKHLVQLSGGLKKKHLKTTGSWSDDQKGVGGGSNRLGRYKVPDKLVEALIS